MRSSAVSTRENLPSSPRYLIFHYRDVSKYAKLLLIRMKRVLEDYVQRREPLSRSRTGAMYIAWNDAIPNDHLESSVQEDEY
jgi:hypothetical protein